MLILLLACSGPPDGTWLFELAVTAPTGEECTDASATHNYTGGYLPDDDALPSEWTDTSTATLSPALFFGRIEAAGDSYVLIVDDAVYPGTETPNGWSFAWTTSALHVDEHAHATGYLFALDSERTATTTIAGTFQKGAFQGTWKQSTTAMDAWVESDTWSEEARVSVGDHGETPVADYLVLVDDYGAEVPVSNTWDGFDCSDAECTLTVQSACAYSYSATGKLTEFEPDDNSWVDDATQAPGT